MWTYVNYHLCRVMRICHKCWTHVHANWRHCARSDHQQDSIIQAQGGGVCGFGHNVIELPFLRLMIWHHRIYGCNPSPQGLPEVRGFFFYGPMGQGLYGPGLKYLAEICVFCFEQKSCETLQNFADLLVCEQKPCETWLKWAKLSGKLQTFLVLSRNHGTLAEICRFFVFR